MFTVGKKGSYGTHNPNTIYDEQGNAICMVYGIASNVTLEDLDKRDAKGLQMAYKIVEALNASEQSKQAQKGV